MLSTETLTLPAPAAPSEAWERALREEAQRSPDWKILSPAEDGVSILTYIKDDYQMRFLLNCVTAYILAWNPSQFQVKKRKQKKRKGGKGKERREGGSFH